jgi:glycosyltransferase involved in cell wall biosynthesis
MGTDEAKRNSKSTGVSTEETSQKLRARLRKLEAELEQVKSDVLVEEHRISEFVALERANRALLQENQALRTRSVWKRLFRVKKILRRIKRKLSSKAVKELRIAPSLEYSGDDRYQLWIDRYDTFTKDDELLIKDALSRLTNPPLLSVIMPTYNPPRDFFDQAVRSILDQWYGNLELCIADDCSSHDWVDDVLANYERSDVRVKVVRRSENGHISAASNTALSIASGDYIVLMDQDDLLPPYALAMFVLTIAKNPSLQLLFSDEDLVNTDNERMPGYSKSGYNPLLFLGQNCVSHILVARRNLVNKVGGFRLGLEGSQDWDLVLRMCEHLSPEEIHHIPQVLYHWRVHELSTAATIEAKPYAALAGQRAVREHLERLGVSATVSPLANRGYNRIHFHVDEPAPLVSIVVIARHALTLIAALDSLFFHLTYPTVEVIVVDDGDERAPLKAYIRDRANSFRVIEVGDDKSDGALRNIGAAAASGEYICFLDDQIIITTDHWLTELIGVFSYPRVGAVGPKMLDHHARVVSTGIVGGIGGTVGNPHRGIDRHWLGYQSRAYLIQSVSALTSGCFIVRRSAFEDVGGISETTFPVLYWSVDLCWRMVRAGWTVAMNPFATVQFHEQATLERPNTATLRRHAREVRELRRRYPDFLTGDPFYSPNLTLAHENWALAWPPRYDWRSLLP